MLKRGLLLAMSVCVAQELAAAELSAPSSSLELVESLSSCRKLAADKRLRLSLHGEVGPVELVAALAPLSCRPLVLGSSASRSGRVSIEAPDLMSPLEATRLLMTGLDSLGLTLEETGSVLRVVDSARGREIAAPLGSVDKLRGRETFVLRLVRLSEAAVDEVATTVGKLRSKDGEVVAVPQSRSLLLVDRLAQVERMEALAHALDRPALPARLFVLPTHRQRPSELTDALEKIVLGAGPRGDKADTARPTLLAVDAARVLLFSGSELSYRRIEALLARIDPPLEPGEERGARLSVLYLKHIGAEELAATLKEVLSQGRAARPAAGGLPAPAAIEGEVKLTADKVNNALIVAGNPADLEAVRELVARLDMPRRQVYVEAAILDLSADLSRAVGISLHQAAARSDGQAQGIVASSSSSLASIDVSKLAAAASGAGLFAGVLGQAFDVAGISVPSFGVVLQALETTRNASVLSRPHLMTLDHSKASLSVGQRIPFPIQSLSAPAAAGALGIQKSYQREKVALTLDLTPHLSDDSEIRLEIESEISDVTGVTGEGGPTTNQRTLKTTVVVKDGETVVLGGLQKESASDSVEKVPLLGDIPVLGRLFQTKKRERVKQDLLIVLTPYVIRDTSDLRRIYERKEAERRELIQRGSLFTDPNAYDPHVDYRRKRGLLEEINRAALLAEDERRALADARLALAPRRAIAAGEIVVEERLPDRLRGPGGEAPRPLR